MDERFAAAGADVANRCLTDAALRTSDVDVIVAAPAHHAFRATLAERLGVPIEKIVVAEDERTHTAALAAGIERAATGLAPGGRALLVVVGAGVTAGAALYRQAAPPGDEEEHEMTKRSTPKGIVVGVDGSSGAMSRGPLGRP